QPCPRTRLLRVGRSASKGLGEHRRRNQPARSQRAPWLRTGRRRRDEASRSSGSADRDRHAAAHSDLEPREAVEGRVTDELQRQIAELRAVHKGLTEASESEAGTVVSGKLPFEASADGLESIVESFDV